MKVDKKIQMMEQNRILPNLSCQRVFQVAVVPPLGNYGHLMIVLIIRGNETMGNKKIEKQKLKIFEFECRHCSKRVSINGDKRSVYPVGWKLITKENDHSVVSFHLCPQCYAHYKSDLYQNVL